MDMRGWGKEEGKSSDKDERERILGARTDRWVRVGGNLDEDNKTKYTIEANE